jgi:hypothetical protein
VGAARARLEQVFDSGGVDLLRDFWELAAEHLEVIAGVTYRRLVLAAVGVTIVAGTTLLVMGGLYAGWFSYEPALHLPDSGCYTCTVEPTYRRGSQPGVPSVPPPPPVPAAPPVPP